MTSVHSRFTSMLCLAISLVAVQSAVAGNAGINSYSCGKLQGGYGPFDFRTIAPDVRHRVEDYHFTPDVESGKKGATVTGPAGADLDYTLRAIPNNPRALLAVTRVVAHDKTERPFGMQYAAECYFERAIRFAPDDPMPHLIYAIYLRQLKRMADVLPELDQAAQLRGEQRNFDFDYNLGLLYLDVGAYDKSLEAAKRAYALGAPLPALQKRLKSLGKWQD